MTKSKIPFLKRQLVVFPKFQYSLVSFFIICSIINSAIFFVAINGFFWSVKRSLFAAQISAQNPIFQFLSNQQGMLNVVLVSVTLLGAVATFWGGLWLSNKVAGPLYRMLRILKECDEKKDYTSLIKFRDGDYLFEVQDGFNAHLNVVKDQLQAKRPEDFYDTNKKVA